MAKTTAGFYAARAARERGETRYFTGLPCKAGHIAERQVANGTCVECLEVRRKDNMHWFREHDAKRRQKPERKEYHNANERKNRKQPHRRVTRAAERMARIASQLQRTPKWVDLKAIKKFYDVSHWMTEVTGIEHHVDHILPLNGRLVSGLHIAENLRVLPGPENLAKGSKFMT
jgi:hypothetical protein